LDQLLYSQLGNESSWALASQDSPNDENDTEFADDFIVPAEGWEVGGVRVLGNLFTDVTSADLNFYADDAGLPGELVCSGSDLNVLIGPGSDLYTGVSVELVTPCTLEAGTYWVSVVANVSEDFIFFIAGQSVVTNSLAAFRNPGDGLELGCTEWVYASDCYAELGANIFDGFEFEVYTYIEPTITPTPSDTPTPTDTPEATNTPTPTETPIPPVTLLTNGSFETDADTDKVPDGWTAKNATKDKLKCGTEEAPIAYDGLCVYQFKGGVLERSKLSQNGDTALVISGDTITLGGYLKAKGGVNTKVKVRVTYTDTSIETGKITFKQTSAVSDWTAFGGDLSLVLAGEPSVIKVQIQNKGISGKVLYDALSLNVDGAGSIIPLP
jgi:hypothetical protein